MSNRIWAILLVLTATAAFAAGFVVGGTRSPDDPDPSSSAFLLGKASTSSPVTERTPPTDSEKGDDDVDPESRERELPAVRGKRPDGNRESGGESVAPGGQRPSPRPLAVDVYDDHGEVQARVDVIPVSSPWNDEVVFLALDRAIRGASGARFVDREAGARLTGIAGRHEIRGLILLRGRAESRPFALSRTIAARDDEAWLVDSSGDRRPVRLADREIDSALGVETFRMSLQTSGERGGAVTDDGFGLVGLAIDANHEGASSRMIPLATSGLLDFNRIDATFAEFADLSYTGTAEDLVRRARKLLERKLYRRAAETFASALRRDPGIRTDIAEDLRAAIAGWLKSAPRASRATRRKAILHEALVISPNEVDYWVDLAGTSSSIDEFEAALHAWDEAWRLDPGAVPDVDATRGALYVRWGAKHEARGRRDEALVVVERGIREIANNAELWRMYGRLLMGVREYAQAASAFREALALDPRASVELEGLIARADRFSEGPGKVVIDYTPGSRSIVTRVAINGAFGDFIVDTGATTTMIPDELARRAGLDTGTGVPRVRVRTAGNERILPLSPTRDITIGDLAVTGKSVIVGDLPGMGNRGLLGMDYLGAFVFENDSANGRFVIFEKR